MYAYLRNQQSISWNHKRVYRVYCEMKLNIRVKPKKKLPKRKATQLSHPVAANLSWSLDFISDSLSLGRAFSTLEMIASWRSYPKQLRLDNGPELISQKLALWAIEYNVKLAFIQLGKPTQNAYIERFNRTFRKDVLDTYIFSSL